MTTFSAEAARRNLTIDQGDDEKLTITREDSNGNAKDISQYTFWLTIKDTFSQSDGNAPVQKKVTSHTAPASGETEIQLTPTDTEDLGGKYLYDIQEETDTGAINTLVHGSLFVREDVTEAP